MASADLVVLRSARNAYLLVLLVLLGVSFYQFFTIGTLTWPIGAVWVAAVAGFYASKFYYGRD